MLLLLEFNLLEVQADVRHMDFGCTLPPGSGFALEGQADIADAALGLHPRARVGIIDAKLGQSQLAEGHFPGVGRFGGHGRCLGGWGSNGGAVLRRGLDHRLPVEATGRIEGKIDPALAQLDAGYFHGLCGQIHPGVIDAE